jgi:hypothetical protein
VNVLQTEFLNIPRQLSRMIPTKGMKFYVIRQEGGKQIRKYRPLIIAQTYARGTFEDALRLGKERLRRYFGGENNLAEEVPRASAWYVAKTRTPYLWMVSTPLTPGHPLAEAPMPLNGNIQILRIPALVVAVQGGSGIWSLEQAESQAEELKLWVLKQEDCQVMSKPRWITYGGERLPSFLKTSEVHITLRVKTE